MNAKMPSLFDDEFFDQYEKEDHIVPEQEENREDGAEKEPEDKKTPEEARTPENAALKETPKPISPENKPKQRKPVSPALELPDTHQNESLDQQLLQELVTTDYTPFIQKDYPFDPGAVEMVSGGKPKTSKKELSKKAVTEEVPEPLHEESATPLPEWDLKKNYYTIGEVAALFDVNISHIRFWTTEFKLKLRTTRKGDRLYTPEQIATLRLVHYLVKVKKHTLKGAKEKLKTQKETIENNLGLKDALIQLKTLLLEIKEGLD